MRWLLILLTCATLAIPARAEARMYEQAELEALLAPVALQQDGVLWNVLAAATEPDQVAEAAQWSRMNRGFSGSDAVRAVQDQPWSDAVKALVAHPELLERMAESPQWTFDLGTAYLAQEQEVLATVQVLRQRAYAAGTLQSDSAQIVQLQGEVLAVQPAVPHVYHVRYYDPLVVYGPWWHSHRPVLWRPWAPRAVFVNHVVVIDKHRHHRRHDVHRKEAHRKDLRRDDIQRKEIHGKNLHWRNGPPSPAARLQQRSTRDYLERQKQHRPAAQPYRRIPESRRRPIVQSGDRLQHDERPRIRAERRENDRGNEGRRHYGQGRRGP